MHIFLCYGYDSHTTGTYFEKALAKAHDVHYVGSPWRERPGRSANEDLSALVSEGILPKPDLVLYIDSGRWSFPRGLETLDCPTAVYLIDVHRSLQFREHLAVFFDHVFVCHKDYVDHFSALGHRSVHWMPVACDPEIHGRIDLDRTMDVGFVGRLDVHPERARLLEALQKRYTMNDFHRPCPKEDITNVYSKSKIVFNYAIQRDLNMRVFEALAGGALLLTNRIDNGMSDLLQAGEHFVEYTDQRSLFDNIDYYLAHDAERERIAEAGRVLVTSKHTYERRCQVMLDTIFASPHPKRLAKARSMTATELRNAYGNVYVDLKMVDAALDEFSLAWAQRAGRLSAARNALTAMLKRLNAIVMLTPRLKRLKEAVRRS
jgi:glycosyltransferase involved in cell wall biosynthesis